MNNIIIGNANNADKSLIKKIEWAKNYGQSQIDHTIKKSISDFSKNYIVVYMNEIYKKLSKILNGENLIKDTTVIENKNGEKFIVIGKENGIVCHIIEEDSENGKYIDLSIYKYYEKLPEHLKQKMKNILDKKGIENEEINELVVEMGNYDVDNTFSIENIIDKKEHGALFVQTKFYFIEDDIDDLEQSEDKKDFERFSKFLFQNSSEFTVVFSQNFVDNLIDEVEYLKNIFGINDIIKESSKYNPDKIYGSCNDLKKIYANRIALSLKNVYEDKKEDLNKLFFLFKENDMNDLNKRIVYNDLDEYVTFIDNEQYTAFVEDNISCFYTQSHLNVLWKDENGNYKTWDIYPCLVTRENHEEDIMENEDGEEYEEDIDFIYRSVIFKTEQYKKHGENKTFREILHNIDKIDVIKDRALSYNIQNETIEIDFDNIKNCSNLVDLQLNLDFMIKCATEIFEDSNSEGHVEILTNGIWKSMEKTAEMKM